MGETYLDAGDDQALAAFTPFLWKMWGRDMPLDSYSTFLQEIAAHPWMRGHVRTLVLRDEPGQFLAHLRLHAVHALHYGEEVRLGGIAAVLTPEPFRGRGYASRLMRLTLDLLAQEGIDGAYLFSDIAPAFYERLGFRLLGNRLAEIPLEGAPPRSDLHVRPAGEKDWSAIHRIHEEAGDGQPLWLLRTPVHWDYLLRRRFRYAGHAGDASVEPVERIVEKDGRTLGYAMARLESDALELLEFGLAEHDPSILDALLHDLRDEAARAGRPRITAPWPPGSWGRMFEGRFAPKPRADSLFMVSALSPRLDLDRLVREEQGFWDSDHI